MTAAERGKRIKEARISKKMTQSEVVGDFITRNMLSQIESGIATPSVKTLEYLASVLDIPVAELMPKNDSEVSEEVCTEASGEAERMAEVKALYACGEYGGALEILGTAEDWRFLKDEFYALSARCLLGFAEKTAETDTVKAIEYAKKSAELSQVGIYASTELKVSAVKLLNSLAEKMSRYYAGMISDI